MKLDTFSRGRTTSGLSLVTVIVSVSLLVGCTTTGTIPVAFDENELFYISPQNQDGVQDDISVPTDVVPLERTVLKAFNIEIYDESGMRVRNIEESVPPGRWWSRKERRRPVTVPEIVLWDGRDDAGAWVPDGAYGLSITVTDNKGNTGTAADVAIIVDNTAPSVTLSSAYMQFTPNGDGRLDDIQILQEDSTWEDRWVGTLAMVRPWEGGSASPAETVREWTWQGNTPTLVWEGKTESGDAAAPGYYRYELSATDRAGNSARFELDDILLLPEAHSVAIDVSRDAFSPNGDGTADTVTLTARPQRSVDQRDLEGWEISIVDRFGLPLRTITVASSGVRVVDALPIAVYDGTDDAGHIAPDGIYRALLTTRHTGGRTNTVASAPFEIDTVPPYAAVNAPFYLFSPDGDGRRDTLPINHIVDEELQWHGEMVLVQPDEAAEENSSFTADSVVASYTWNGTPEDIAWDGMSSRGEPAPDGIYLYRLAGTDPAGNTVTNRVTRIRMDRRPTPVGVAPGYRRFSPNGDGRFDTLPIRTDFGLPQGLESWRITVVSEEGSDLGIIASDTTLPSTMEWDGRLDGRLLPDGIYSFRLDAAWTKGNISADQSEPFFIDTTPPALTMTSAPKPFSPDADARGDLLNISLSARDRAPLEGWVITIFDPGNLQFRRFSGNGTPPATIQWDGRSETGELVQSAASYRITAEVRDVVGNMGHAEDEALSDILVIREGDRLRIVLSSIVFAPYSADYRFGVPPENARENLETLDRLAKTLERFPEYSISLEGHAVSVLWDQPARARREHEEVLIPLSFARAEAIRDALMERGIEGSRMTTRGYGGSRPVVPHGDVENRWKSRRVEFVLSKR